MYIYLQNLIAILYANLALFVFSAKKKNSKLNTNSKIRVKDPVKLGMAIGPQPAGLARTRSMRGGFGLR